ncbi:MAG TPA: hypothetical protein VIM13_07495 [Clostridia bacterium]
MPAQFTILFLAIVPLAFLIYAWASIGSPKILKRTAMLALIVPAVHLLFLLMAGSRNIFGFFIKDIIVCAIPFLCVFLNARRFDKSISLKRALMFWLPD